MNDAEILAAIAEVARTHLDWEGTLAPGSRLVETLGLDSLRALTLVVEIENRFAIVLEEGEERGVETAGEMVALVRAKLAAPGGSGGA